MHVRYDLAKKPTGGIMETSIVSLGLAEIEQRKYNDMLDVILNVGLLTTNKGKEKNKDIWFFYDETSMLYCSKFSAEKNEIHYRVFRVAPGWDLKNSNAIWHELFHGVMNSIQLDVLTFKKGIWTTKLLELAEKSRRGIKNDTKTKTRKRRNSGQSPELEGEPTEEIRERDNTKVPRARKSKDNPDRDNKTR